MSTAQRHRVAAEIRAAVARAGVGRGELADRLQMSRAVLARKLDGYSPFGVDEVIAVAVALNLSPRHLVDAAAASITQ